MGLQHSIMEIFLCNLSLIIIKEKVLQAFSDTKKKADWVY